MWEEPQCGDSFQFSPFSVLCLLPSNPAHPSSLDCLHSLPARSPLPARLNRPCRSSWLAPLSSFANRSLTATRRGFSGHVAHPGSLHSNFYFICVRCFLNSHLHRLLRKNCCGFLRQLSWA